MTPIDSKVYWEYRLRSHFDLQGVGYLALGKHFNYWLYRIRQRVFRRVADSLNMDLQSAAVLDVGCGTGFYIDQWKHLGVRTIAGIDLTDVAVQRLRRRFPNEQFYQLDIADDLAIRGMSQYDAVSAFDVLFHITDDGRFQKAIDNIHAMLRPGGLFLFSDNFIHIQTARTAHHVSRPLWAIQRVLHKSGFQVLKRVPMFVSMNYPADTKSSIYRLLWSAMVFPATKSELFGLALGAALYPLEMMLTSIVKESPTTEIMVCRKPD